MIIFVFAWRLCKGFGRVIEFSDLPSKVGLTHHLCEHAKSDEMNEKEKQKFQRQSSKS